MKREKFFFRGVPHGEAFFPGDKSISHRVLMIGALVDNSFRVKNFSWGKDNLSTKNIMEALGVEIEEIGEDLVVYGVGLRGLREADDVLDAGNSGTTMRLMTGLLSWQDFYSVLTGDKYLRKRPMGRVIDPLKRRGASIWARANDSLAPISIRGERLDEFSWKMEVPSAQVKSAILLSGLQATGSTRIEEIAPTRDHTERMLKFFGADIDFSYPRIELRPVESLHGRDLVIPGDLSSAAFFIVLALIVEGAEVVIKDVLLNPTRTGIVEILRKMGASIEVVNYTDDWEPRGDLVVRGSRLKNVEISGDEVVRAIDEIPVLAVAGALAEGRMVVKDARELRVKETDRIRAIVENLKKFGVRIEEMEDGFVLYGGVHCRGEIEVDSFGDHRIAMAFAILGSALPDCQVDIRGFEMVEISFPTFKNILWELTS